uniref:Uncharacterized protein n=1 Tax=Tetradesmus obliquus TaxID=3088 RepID=A0A383W148_TETOB|eukprot:jgi/Sobl393_1/12055/SZX70823.1
MTEVTEEEPIEDEDAALGQQTAAMNIEKPGYDEDFEDNPDDLAAALKTASSSLGTAAALAAVAARDADPLLAAAAASAVQQQLPIKLQQQQQQQPQLQHHRTHSHADNACEQQAPGIAQAGSSSPQQLAQLLTQQYLDALHSGKLGPAPAAAPAAKHAAAGAAARQVTTPSSLQGSAGRSSSSSRRSSSASPTRSSRPATAAAAAAASRSCRTPDLLLSRPLSAQLRSWPAAASRAPLAGAAAAAAGHNSTWPPPAAGGRSASAEPRSRSCGRLRSPPPKPKRYSPGPGDYSPQTDRAGTPLLPARPGTGSFPAADRYEGSYIEAFAKTIHSPGPIYYPSNACCGSDSAAVNSSTSGRSSSSTAAASMTARCSHSAAGTWARADVGSRECLPMHSCSCSGSSGGGLQDGSSCQRPSTAATSQQQRSASPPPAAAAAAAGGVAGGCARCAACEAAAWSVPGPGSYDVPVGRDGRGLLLAQSCPAFSVPKAGRLLAGRKAPFLSSRHALHDNLGCESPGPAYKPDLAAVRPGSCSPTMQGRGRGHWEALASSSRAASARQILGPTHITRYSTHLLGDGLRTHFGTASLDRWPGAFISEAHSAVQNGLRYGAEPHYRSCYSQVDGHVAAASLGSGPEDRFDDKWLPRSGRL